MMSLHCKGMEDIVTGDAAAGIITMWTWLDADGDGTALRKTAMRANPK